MVTPPVVVVTTYVAVPTYIAIPVPQSDDSDVLNIVTTVSGLVASLVGLLTAVISVRGTRAR